MIETPVQSSNLARVGWEDGNLYVQFNSGQCWRYLGVPIEGYQELVAAPSVGKHFLRNVRGQYPDEKVTSGTFLQQEVHA